MFMRIIHARASSGDGMRARCRHISARRACARCYCYRYSACFYGAAAAAIIHFMPACFFDAAAMSPR